MRKLLPLALLGILLLSCKKTIVTPYEFALLSADVYDDNTLTLPPHLQPFLDFEEKENLSLIHI